MCRRWDMLRPTDGFVTITPANEVNSHAVKYYKEQWTKCITDRPKWFIGRYAHKYFPEWKAVCMLLLGCWALLLAAS
eukprot:COSAG01_NODE_7928_length_2988_cov_102.404292_1_plen_77_part_00